VELTDGCYSEGDSQGLPGFIHPRVLGIPTISFQLKSLLSCVKTRGYEEEGLSCGKTSVYHLSIPTSVETLNKNAFS